MAKILIIEDEAPIRDNLVRFLRLEGYTALTAENGRLGLEIARLELPDLILCDVMMPEMNGIAVLDALRHDPAIEHTPFIFLTAGAEREDMQAGLTHGADNYVTKPFNLRELLSTCLLYTSRCV